MARITICVLMVLSLAHSAVARQEPAFAGFWSDKEPGGVGGLFYGLTWDALVARWKELGARNQYLADVETYEVNGQRRYAAIWRVGAGNGALWASPWTEFAKRWTEWKDTQDLIDLEVYESDGKLMYLGVFRDKQGSGGSPGRSSWQSERSLPRARTFRMSRPTWTTEPASSSACGGRVKATALCT
jgi:polyglycine hydrolase-like protein